MKIDRTNGIKELKWLLEKGIITQEIYDEAMNATDEEIEYDILRNKIGKLINNSKMKNFEDVMEEVKQIEKRLEELKKIIKEQKKDKKGE